MKLKRLTIELIPSYRDDAGKYEATIGYEGQRGNVELKLDPEISNALLLCIGGAVEQFAAKSAEILRDNIVKSVEEAKRAPLIEA